MGTKNQPSTYDCHAAAHPDEPMFVLLGRDRMAPTLVEMWAAARAQAGEPQHVVEEARDCVASMRQWLYQHRRQEVRVLEVLPTEVLVAELRRRTVSRPAQPLAAPDAAPQACAMADGEGSEV
jgi:hypothetical protein